MFIHGVSGLLISAAAGYWVLTSSGSQKGRIKTLGQWLGLIIVVVSLVGAACKLYYITTGASGKGYLCPSGKACPFSPRMSSPVPQG